MPVIQDLDSSLKICVDRQVLEVYIKSSAIDDKIVFHYASSIITSASIALKMPSLLDDEVWKHLWLKVQQLNSYEDAAQSFWHHLYTKKVFTDSKYVVDYEEPPIPEEQGLRKVDTIVKEFDHLWGELFFLLFHEIKKNECTPADLEYVETQAFTACQSYCNKHKISTAYAQTSVGTRARFLVYQSGHWTPCDNKPLASFEAYQEFGDPLGEKYILEMLNYIKSRGATRPELYVSLTFQKHNLMNFAGHGIGTPRAGGSFIGPLNISFLKMVRGRKDRTINTYSCDCFLLRVFLMYHMCTTFIEPPQ